VVTLDKKSAPRAALQRRSLLEVDLPAGTRVVYPRPPIEALKDVDAAIRYALNHPLNCDPLHAKLRPGMKVVIAIDDISLPLPPMRRPDVRERVLTSCWRCSPTTGSRTSRSSSRRASTGG
jgi:hypothetical protein